MLQKVQTIAPALKIINSGVEIREYRYYLGTYLVTGEKKALVDIGPRVLVPDVLKILNEIGIQPEEIDYIILSHIHIDHGGGAGTALKLMKNARVITHVRGRKHIIDPSALWEASLETLGETAVKYGQIEPVPEDRVLIAEQGMKLDLGKDVVLEFLMTPGHAAHHLSIFEPTAGFLLAGDSAGVFTSGGLRLSTPPPFRLGDYLASLDRMIALQPKLLCYAHYNCYPDAVARLSAAKEKALMWYEIAQSGEKAGKTPEQVASEVRKKDKNLTYFNTLGSVEFERDNTLLVTSIHGMMTAQS